MIRPEVLRGTAAFRGSQWHAYRTPIARRNRRNQAAGRSSGQSDGPVEEVCPNRATTISPLCPAGVRDAGVCEPGEPALLAVGEVRMVEEEMNPYVIS